MNRKHKTLKWGIALVSSMLTLNLSAQSSLIDYQSDKVDLGMGVEQSQMLTTASVEVVSGDELQKTAVQAERSVTTAPEQYSTFVVSRLRRRMVYWCW